MTLLSALISRAQLRRAHPRHFRAAGGKRVACAKPRVRKTTSLRELVTCDDCRMALRLAGVITALVLCACGDNAPVAPDAAVDAPPLPSCSELGCVVTTCSRAHPDDCVMACQPLAGGGYDCTCHDQACEVYP